MTAKCRRCDWRSDPDLGPDGDQAAQHAVESGHWRCPICREGLSDTDGLHGCESCLTTSREHLSGIVTLYDELPRQLGHPKPTIYDQDAQAAADGRPLPGGDALVLLSRGSEGLAEDGTTSKDGDPVSVPFTLSWWAKDWRETRNDPDLSQPGSVRHEVHAAAGYLEVHSRWAANSHPGFGQYAADIRDLHRTLEAATGRLRTPVRLDVICLDCHAELIRRINDHGLEEEAVTCTGCRRQYDHAGYLMAVRAAYQAAELPEWAEPRHVAAKLGLKEHVLRNWASRGHVASRRIDGRLHLHVPDVHTKTATAQQEAS